MWFSRAIGLSARVEMYIDECHQHPPRQLGIRKPAREFRPIPGSGIMGLPRPLEYGALPHLPHHSNTQPNPPPTIIPADIVRSCFLPILM